MRNPFILKALAARSATKDPLQAFTWTISIPGMGGEIGFQKCSGLSEEVDVAEYDESGYDYVHKLPGKRKFGEVSLEKGVYADNDMKEYLEKAFTDANFRDTVVIKHKDRMGNIKRVYTLAEAWCSKWEAADLDASSGDVAIEKMTLVYEYLA